MVHDAVVFYSSFVCISFLIRFLSVCVETSRIFDFPWAQLTHTTTQSAGELRPAVFLSCERNAGSFPISDLLIF